ncbi:unnamed protein product (macronuclear) [Paramecium tetraurelia]|uniref:non-specific serine/threonine protein kinase n=1 Tax=Paramecium tetraurelia TaxID=5888 RepID=A0C3Q4_PARTE|nr:uncharacterized protein GSPATT00034900001 [Paramecium tetraurelia]CAK65421.1 unnamed protein product [Paramecium tetraurelia]|eukprot:XP_001432818.1 hypothetical protein (macronuclear) [Paramecium tetraurelia strain d4-2]
MSQSKKQSQFEEQMQSSQGFKQDYHMNGQIEELMDQLDQEHDSEDEGLEEYRREGYHPAHIGEVLLNRYVVIQKLGWGRFSTVWLAKDFKYDSYVAIKILKSSPNQQETAYDEVEILYKIAQNVQNPVWIQSLKEYYADQGRTSFNRDDTHTVQLLNSFLYKGPYGYHFCMVFEILGVNLLEIIKQYEFRGCPMNIVRRMAQQLLIGLDYLHRICGVVHTDLKPENILLCLSDEEIKYIAENGQLTSNQLFSDRINIYRQILGIGEDKSAVEEENTLQKQEENDLDSQSTNLTKTQKRKLLRKKKQQQEQQNELKNQNHEKPKSIKELFQQQQQISCKKKRKLPDNFRIKIADLGNACWVHHHFSEVIQTRQYRSPEVLLGISYNQTADIWSSACVIFEMLTGEWLFEPSQGPNFSTNEDHLAQIQELLGKFSMDYIARGLKAKRYFTNDGKMKRIPQINYWTLLTKLIEKYNFKQEEALQFASFIMPMLNALPEYITTAQEVLQRELCSKNVDDQQRFTVLKKYLGHIFSFQNFRHNIPNSGWLKAITNYQIGHFMNDEEFRKYRNQKREDQEKEDDLNIMGIQNSLLSNNQRAQKRSYDGSNSQTSQQDQNIKQDGKYVDHRVIDRSFTDLGYIGYGDGIDLEQLDSTGNWQFN